MGCCWSFFCEDDNSSQAGEPTERTHLLTDPVSNNINILGINSEDIISGNGNSITIKTDEQSALNRILQETATNVIDVAAVDSHNLGQHEYLERVRTYNTKVHHILSNHTDKLVNGLKLNCLLEDVPLPEQILSANLLEDDDRDLITTYLESARSAVKDIEIEHKEDLVVPFGIGLKV